MRSLALPLLSAAALTIPSCAEILQAAWTPPSSDVAKAPVGTYAIEPTHTQVMFSVLHLGFTNYYGTFSGASGSLTFTPENPSRMAISVSVPVSSVSTTSAKLDEELKSADWLDAARYPAMTFTSTTITAAGPQEADIIGMLTLHGISRPVTLHATFNGAGVNPLDHKETLGFQISGQIRRSDFGVSNYVPLVSDAVTLIIAAAFEK
jgi:polyisoprenoid-binding protein YceI